MRDFIEPRNWWNRDYAIEWWRNNGHFDEDLYLSVLMEKELRKNQPKQEIKKKENDENRTRKLIFFRFIPIRKWLGIERKDMA